MIDSQFIIQYTNALYSTPEEYAPRYNEFRDMFSSGQIKSKEWLVDELLQIDGLYYAKSIAIAGAWYGTLGLLLKRHAPNANINMIDIDPRCKHFVDNIIYKMPSMKYITADMYEYHYNEDLVINTSCEHIPDLREWLNIIPMGRTVVLQSNNYKEAEGHVNCVNSEDEFISKTGLSEIWFSGKLEMPMYTRYMVIGTT